METYDIHHYVERLSELFRVDLRQAGSEHGLQPVQLEALHYLSICNRFSDTPMAVTEYLGQTKGTVSQTLKVLENKGLLTKQADNKDKRIAHLKVTAKAKRLLEKTIPSPMFNNANASLSDKQKSEITEALKELLLKLMQTNGLKTFGVCSTCQYNSNIGENKYYCNLVNQPLNAIDIKLICREHEK